MGSQSLLGRPTRVVRIILIKEAVGLIVMAPEDGVKIKSDQLIDAGMRDIEGTSFAMYNGSNFTLGDTLDIAISGQPKRGSDIVATGESPDNTGLVIGIGAFGAVLVGMGVYLWNKNRRADEFEDDVLEIDGIEVCTSTAETPEDMMDAIIALDDLYQSGDLPEEAYLKRRAELKSCLQKLLEQAN